MGSSTVQGFCNISETDASKCVRLCYVPLYPFYPYLSKLRVESFPDWVEQPPSPPQVKGSRGSEWRRKVYLHSASLTLCGNSSRRGDRTKQCFLISVCILMVDGDGVDAFLPSKPQNSLTPLNIISQLSGCKPFLNTREALINPSFVASIHKSTLWLMMLERWWYSTNDAIVHYHNRDGELCCSYSCRPIHCIWSTFIRPVVLATKVTLSIKSLTPTTTIYSC